MKKLTLKTDFIDYYDHWFDELIIPEPHHNLKRISRTSHRKDAFNYLTEHYPLVAPNNEVEIMETVFPGQEVVVYTDPYAHAGMGKDKMPVSEAVKKYPGHYSSLFIPHEYTIRMLHIGTLQAFLKYSSNHPWKTNVGSVEILPFEEPLLQEVGFHEDFPLVAVDFVVDVNGNWFAVDLNTAPLIKFTPLQDIMKPIDIVNEIRNWMEWKYGN